MRRRVSDLSPIERTENYLVRRESSVDGTVASEKDAETNVLAKHVQLELRLERRVVAREDACDVPA